MKLSIVIPAFNEEKSIGAIIERLLKEKERIQKALPQIQDVELIVVNDGSTDDTAAVVSGYKEILLFNRHRNYGYGAALKYGFNNAAGEIIAFLDADGTYQPEEILNLCRELLDKGLDIVRGCRISRGRKKMQLLRFTGNKLFSKLASWITHHDVLDAASGMWVFRSRVLDLLYPLPDGMNFTLAMTLKAKFEGLKSQEVEISYDSRTGDSKLKPFKDGVNFLFSALNVAETYDPLKLFGLAGIILILIAFGYGIYPVFYYLENRLVPEWMIYRFLAILVLTSSGIIAFSVGILSNFIISLIRNKRMADTPLNNLLYNCLMKKISPLGIFLILLGVAINYKTIYQYIMIRQIYEHWSYIVTGAFLVLTGFQLYMVGVLVRIMKSLSDSLNRKEP